MTKIMIVDDIKDIREMLESLLQNEGFETLPLILLIISAGAHFGGALRNKCTCSGMTSFESGVQPFLLQICIATFLTIQATLS